MKDNSELLNKLTMEISRNKEVEAVNDIYKKLDILMASMETSAFIIENNVDAINQLDKKYRKLKKKSNDIEDRIKKLEDKFESSTFISLGYPDEPEQIKSAREAFYVKTNNDGAIPV